MTLFNIHHRLLSCAVVLLLTTPSFSQQNEYQAKSAYLYNFAKLTHWPYEILATRSKLVFGVYGGDEDFIDVLRATVAGKPIDEHLIEVRRLESSAEFRSCHLVFVRTQVKDLTAVLGDLASGTVLLVGEDKDFLKRGGMINFVEREEGIAYEINASAIARSVLKFDQHNKVLGANNVADQEARLVKLPVTPVYPELARRMNVIGSVQLLATVRADGTVKEIHVIGGHPLLAEAASRAVMQWRYQPAVRETTEQVKINFGK